MTITSAPYSLRSKFALVVTIGALIGGSFAQGATLLASANRGAQSHSPVAESPLILSSGSLKFMTPVFPVMGLIAAAWATHHVRRRNARHLASTR